MGLIERILKWKARWAVLSGLFTLIIIPLAKWFLGRSKKSKVENPKSKVVDAEFEEIKK